MINVASILNKTQTYISNQIFIMLKSYIDGCDIENGGPVVDTQ